MGTIKIAAITPTRGGERKVFLDWCRHQVKRMGYDAHYVIDYEPTKKTQDIYERVAEGVKRAMIEGFQFVSIIEDDDYYKPDYLKVIKPVLSISGVVGFNMTTYYHLFNRGFTTMNHPGRSSLFTTSFDVKYFHQFQVPAGPYFDIALWNSVQIFGIPHTLINQEYALGIKHGIGLCGGNGHVMHQRTQDPSMHHFTRMIGKDWEALEFYKGLKKD